jgi:hypothetical protein
MPKGLFRKLKCSIPFNLFYFPHDNIRIVGRLSSQSYLIECLDCGRRFGVNEDINAILPWECVRSFYEDLPDA